MRTQADSGDRIPPLSTGAMRESLYPPSVQAAPLELFKGLLDPPEVRAELVASLKSAVAHNHYHVPVELVAQSIIDSWAPCLRN